MSIKRANHRVVIVEPKPSSKSMPLTAEEEHFKGNYVYRVMVILIFAAFTYTVLAANCLKFSRAEVFFAECAKEMLETACFITPLYHGVAFFDKPILSYWLIALSFKIFGVSHLAARIPSIAAALFSILITSTAAKKLFGTYAGIISGLLLGSSFMFISFASLCMSDMLLLCFDCITLGLLYLGCSWSKYRTSCFALAALSMGLAFLTKGPVGLVLPLVAFLVYLSLTRQWHLLKVEHFVLAVTIFLLATGPWFLSAYRENGTYVFSYFFLQENWQRFAGSTYDTHKPLWFTVVSFFTGFAPWSVLLPFALHDFLLRSYKNFKDRKTLKNSQSAGELYLWLWLITVVFFFTVSRGKIDYYVLPAYPAAAILISNFLVHSIKTQRQIPFIFNLLLSGSFLVAGVASAILLPGMMQGAHYSTQLFVPVVLMLAGILAGLATWRKEHLKALSLFFVAICLVTAGIAFKILPFFFRLQPVHSWVAIVRASPPNARIAIYAPLSGWLNEITYQTGREPFLINNLKMAAHFLKSRVPTLMLIAQADFEQLPPEVFSYTRVIDSRPYISHNLTPGFIIKEQGKLLEKSPLLLVTNQETLP